MDKPTLRPSCPRLSRASTSFFSFKGVDGRDKPGHNSAWRCLFALAVIAVTDPLSSALAHPSVVPHEHPHGVSMLPDMMALAVAALCVAVGFIVVRHRRRTK